MGRGSRHSQSNQYKPYFTYDERNSRTASYRGTGTTKLQLDVDTGTLKMRVGADSQKPFDACWLCNHTATGPAVTPQGMLYCRACLIEYMVQMKKEIKGKVAAWEAQEAGKAAMQDTASAACAKLRDEAAKNIEDSILPTSGVDLAKTTTAQAAAVAQAANDAGTKKAATTNSFWLAQNAPEAKATQVGKPDETIRDPFNKKPLKLKKLRNVIFTEAKGAEGEERAVICPVSKVTINNATPVTILPSGHAVSKRELERLWGRKLASQHKKAKKEGADAESMKPGGVNAPELRCPLTSEVVDPRDLLDLIDAGTAFAASTADSALGQLEAERYRVAMTIS